MNFLWFLLLGLAAGWIASVIMKGRALGLVGSLVVGVIGAFLGGFLFSLFNVPAYGLLGSLLAAVVGAMLLLAVLGFVRR